MYKWQENALPCEVCGSIGKVLLEQEQIKQIGLCYACTPRRGAVLTEQIGVTHMEDFPDATKRKTLRPEDFYKG